MSKYSTQCPNCGIRLFMPADSEEEFQELWGDMEMVDCSACGENFPPSVTRMNMAGAEFRGAKRILDELFKEASEPQYLTKDGPASYRR